MIGKALFASSLSALLFALPAMAQTRYAPPRTPDGKPDLQGTWTNSSITTLERNNASLPLLLNAEQVKRMEDTRSQQAVADAAPTTSQTAPPAGRDPGGYNAFWLDRGMRVGVVKGQPRSSWITEPADGKMPVSAAGKVRISTILARRSEDGPEGMNPADRCLIGSRGSGGPPMLNNIYNNTYQIVQTPTHVMIVAEMNHDVRIIPIDVARNPANPPKWGGDSVGHYEGNTLVVETVNVMPKQNSNITDKGKVTERFSRMSDGRILYEYTVEDPTLYTQPWKGEMPLSIEEKGMFEYACHEGNYGMFNLLSGGRKYERDGRKNGVRKQIFAGVAEAE